MKQLLLSSPDICSLAAYFFKYRVHIRCHGIGRAMARRVQQGTVQYKIAWSDQDALWLNAVDLPSVFVTAGDSMHTASRKPRQSQLSGHSSSRSALVVADSYRPAGLASSLASSSSCSAVPAAPSRTPASQPSSSSSSHTAPVDALLLQPDEISQRRS